MIFSDLWAVGIDLGGTKMEVAQVDGQGNLHRRIHRPTNAQNGPASVKQEMVAAVHHIWEREDPPPVGVGVGVAGQIDLQRGMVSFSPNLGWRDEPLKEDLARALGLPVLVTNDVRAATWGEWLYGAGQGCEDFVCLFVGTGIGGGIVSGGKILSGCSNTAGELGHITIDLNGPLCRCGNRGCLEAIAGGWAIAERARDFISKNPGAGASLLAMAEGRLSAVSAQTVVAGAKKGDQLARNLIDDVAQALVAGAVSLVNAFNPCRLILGGGIIEGFPELIDRVALGIRQQALRAASGPLEILPAKLHDAAGIIGAAALAMRAAKEESAKREKEG